MFCKLILDTILDVTRQLPVGQGPPFKLRSLRVSLTLSQQGLYTSHLKLPFDLGVHPPEELRGPLNPFCTWVKITQSRCLTLVSRVVWLNPAHSQAPKGLIRHALTGF